MNILSIASTKTSKNALAYQAILHIWETILMKHKHAIEFLSYTIHNNVENNGFDKIMCEALNYTSGNIKIIHFKIHDDFIYKLGFYEFAFSFWNTKQLGFIIGCNLLLVTIPFLFIIHYYFSK